METTTSSAVVDTPSTTSTETSVSSTPASTTTAPTRPASMQAALEQAAGQPSPDGGLAPGQRGTVPGPHGPIPFDVHKTALENARAKAQAEALGGYTPDQFRAMQNWYQRAAQDTPGFFAETLASHPDAIGVLQKILGTLQTNPRWGPELKSLAGKALAAARGQGTPQAPAMVKVQLEDGSVVEMPRDPKAYLAYHQSQWERAVGDKMAPIAESVEALKAEHDAAVYEAQVDHFVSTTLDDVKSWTGVDDAGMKAMAEHLSQAQIDPNDPRAVSLALNQAYRSVIVPTLSAKGQSAYAATLKHKAAAQIETASTQAASPLPKPKNVSDLARLLQSLEQGG